LLTESQEASREEQLSAPHGKKKSASDARGRKTPAEDRLNVRRRNMYRMALQFDEEGPWGASGKENLKHPAERKGKSPSEQIGTRGTMFDMGKGRPFFYGGRITEERRRQTKGVSTPGKEDTSVLMLRVAEGLQGSEGNPSFP